MNTPITKELVTKIQELLNHGLTERLGKPRPGQMCVEAVVCYALGEPHTDRPSCVPDWLIRLKIKLNDHPKHSDNMSRAKVMERIAIAQLGSLHIKKKDFFDLLWLKSHQRILPNLLKPQHKDEWRPKFANVNNLVEFDKLWAKFKLVDNNYYCYYDNYDNYDYDYYYYDYNYYKGLLQDLADILVECCIELKTEGSKYL